MNLTAQPCVSSHLLNVAGGKLQLLQSAGQANLMTVNNLSGATVYIQFFDQLLAPVDTNVPHWAPIPLPAGAYLESDTARGFVNGCWICISTTAATLTANGTSVYLDAGGLYN